METSSLGSMSNIKKNLLIFTVFVFSFSIVFADDVPISESHLNISASVDVPTSCDVTDMYGTSHYYADSYVAICALQATVDQGNISSIDLVTYPGVEGLFINSINDTGDPASQYWALYQNGNFATLGLSLLPVSTGDVIELKLHDFSDNDLGDSISITINSLIPEPEPEPIHHTSNGSSGSRTIEKQIKPTFDTNKAFDFLISKQKENGSFGEELYTDWATIALTSNPNYTEQKEKLKKYFLENKLVGDNLTDYERHSIALMSLGLNPYDTNNQNYVSQITKSFDGKQFGDPVEINDDIFALIVLQNSGYTQNDKMITDAINFIISKQTKDGSWSGSVDMTGAGIEALSAFSPTPGVGESLKNAKQYLKEKQKTDGSWSNISSTAWALEGIMANGDKVEDKTLEYLGENQDIDGGIINENLNNKIWQTSYILASLSDKTWNQIMQKFSAPSLVNDGLKTSSFQNTINNSNQNKFIKKLEKFQKPTQNTIQSDKTNTNSGIETKPIVVKKQGFFRRILSIIFGF